MLSDEEQIRTHVQTWQPATSTGDVDAVLGLITDDVVFLAPGRPAMRKAEFAALSRVPAGSPRPKFDGTSEIQELHESFNGKFRDECPNEHWFVTMAQAREVIEKWRVEYNTDRTHRSLGDLTPAEFAEECLARKQKDVLSTADATPRPY